MTTLIPLDAQAIHSLDLSPARQVIETWLQEGAIASHEQNLSFQIQIVREPDDPRELSEIPEVRLWFVRLDAAYPWLPFLLDASELARYTAMLVPHQFSPVEGIQYNPEALEIFVMHKVFTLAQWLPQQGISSRTRLKFFTQKLGYELDDAFFDLLQL
ncbi:MAG: CRR6 family NdhI maturation factor [Synechococcales cyanobacterium C42_A2020_086]|jgi:hypothetical protein|nr:CRR6 family NdhI maturation factor [Synechococcales cyanobacterium M58_A2018_015]MBF2074892.1 CRR6 family NdhI maturation factor [Synechococcales cyanobacterium C42_A2020_086]